MKLRVAFVLGFVFVILIIVSFVTAAGVSTFYSESRPLEMYYGETKTIDFNLQNMVGDDDVTFKVEITQGAEIASLEEDTYLVKAGTHDVMVPLVVKIPKNYAESVTLVELDFKTVSSGEGGGIAMGAGYKTPFNVVIFEKLPTEFPEIKTIWWIIIGIVLLIVVVLVVLAKRRKNKF